MNCGRVRQNLSAYADGELGTKLRRKVAGHLAACEKCSAELSRLEEVTEAARKSLLKVVSAKTPPGGFREGVMEATQAIPLHRPLLIPARQFAAVAVVIAVASGLLIGLMQEWRFRSAKGALHQKIVQQDMALALAKSDWRRARMQVLAADAKLSELKEQLRLASAEKTEREKTAEGALAPGTWPPVLLSLQAPGARSLLENGLFGRNVFHRDNLLWKGLRKRDVGERS